MRILHVQESLSPRYGGPSQVLTGLARAQERAGHSVVIATTNADYPRGVYRASGWDTLPGSRVGVLYGGVVFRPLKVSRSLGVFLERETRGFDLVHIHGLYRFPPTYAAYQARRHGVPYIVRPHGSLDPFLYQRSSLSLVLKRLHERLFDLPDLKGAAAIHFTAEAEREKAALVPATTPSFVVPNGVEWDRFAELPERGRLRARWQLGEAPVVLFLGRLHPKKGLEILIDAFSRVRGEGSRAQLVIAGPDNDGHGRDVIEWVRARELQGSVRFVGPLDGEDVVQAYVDADVFALPSHTENFGMTVVEAMACRLPVVVSGHVDIHPAIRSAGAGLVVGGAPELAHALDSLLDDDGRRSRMGEAGRALVRERYTWSAVVGELDAAYEAAVDRHRRGRGPVAPEAPHGSAGRTTRQATPTAPRP